MKMGIIGAGQIGGTLARRLTKLGHEVLVANSRGPRSLAALAKETGAKAVEVREAARFYAADFNAEGVRHALARASQERGPLFRATDKSPGTFAQPA